MLVQRLRRWANIEPTLDKCTMFERKSTACQYKFGVNQFRHPSSNTVSLFATQRPSRGQAKGCELLTHRCRSSIYEVAEALLHSGGPLSREF